MERGRRKASLLLAAFHVSMCINGLLIFRENDNI